MQAVQGAMRVKELNFLESIGDRPTKFEGAKLDSRLYCGATAADLS
jgi:hypothetical protein